MFTFTSSTVLSYPFEILSFIDYCNFLVIFVVFILEWAMVAIDPLFYQTILLFNSMGLTKHCVNYKILMLWRFRRKDIVMKTIKLFEGFGNPWLTISLGQQLVRSLLSCTTFP